MGIDAIFIINSILMGVGLAMDAFSVSMVNGLSEPEMKAPRICLIAGVYALFQIAMPLIGWFLVSRAVEAFGVIEGLLPWISLALLLFIGIKMLIEGIKGGDDETQAGRLGFGTLLVQGIATSIDALAVGFTLAEYPVGPALLEAGIIGAVTFGLCVIGVMIGKKVGTKLAGKASILGGIILIGIGIEIFISGMLS